MVLYKSCPRCAGDRVVQSDGDGVYIMCLACGHVAYPPPEDHILSTPLAARKSA